MKLSKFFCFASFLALIGMAVQSCDCHHFDEPNPDMAIGDILCTDGSVVSFSSYVKTGKEAVAIVYSVNSNPDDEIRGYAVYLADISDEAFCDSTMQSQGTSRNLYNLDGNENTYALYKCEKSLSPMALPVFDLWTYGQSAYIPSVAQLRQIQAVKDFINPRIEAIGGDRLPDEPDDCWYWSSTEVEGQDDIKAWLVSMHSGIIQETPKNQMHHCRPVVTIYRHNNNPDFDTPFVDSDIDNTFRIDMEVLLNMDSRMFDYKDIDSTRYDTRAGSLTWGFRYCVAAYRKDDTIPYAVESSYDNIVSLNLPAGKYTFVGWADRVPTYDDKSYYFHTDDFSEIMLRHKYDYEGNDLAKMAFRGSQEIRVAYTSKSASMTLTPVMARYRLLATDTPDFTPGKVVVSYYDLPASLNGLNGMINGRWSDVSYLSSVSGDELAMDHVLAQENEITVKACVEIYDDRNNLRARVRKVEIPLVKGGITTVKGNFYSILDLDSDESAGGIVIDPEFEETVEIEY